MPWLLVSYTPASLEKSMGSSSPLCSHDKNFQEFFKVFLLKTGSVQLQLPKSFTKFFNGITPCKVTLVDQDRNSLDIHLEKIEDRLVFKSGWEQFVKEKGLEEGDFLIFAYDGKTSFYVKIFSKTGCKKVAAAPASNGISAPIVILDEDFDPTRKKIQRSRKRKRPPTSLKINEKSMLEGPFKGAQSKLKGFNKENDNHYEKNEENNNHYEKKPDPAECVSLLPHNHHFEIHFSSPWRLYKVQIPSALLVELNITISPKIILRDEKDRLWPVAIHKERDRRLTLGQGWSNFRRGNNIQQGQICHFQFIIDKANVVKEMFVRSSIFKCSN